MRPRRMVVVLDKLPKQSLQVALAQDDHKVQKFATEGSHKPLHERILPGTTIGSSYFFDVAGVEELPHATAIDAVVVEEEKSRLLAVRHGLPQLLNHPSHGRVGCDRKMNDLLATVMENQEHVESRESNRDHGEEIDRPGDVQVIPQER